MSRESHLKSKYGLTVEQYDQLLEDQGGNCPICLRHHSEFPIRLAVDHDHVTMEIRGLLCSYCNHRIVGRHRDSERLRRVADYLDKGTTLYVPAPIKSRKRKKATLGQFNIGGFDDKN
jgi:DNA-directed RNA polymerase subunit RPC12/RpoP